MPGGVVVVIDPGNALALTRSPSPSPSAMGDWEGLLERRYGFRRGLCPACGVKRAAELAAYLRDEVVAEVGHARWVFTVPKLLRPRFLSLRELPGPLRTAAWQTVRERMAVAVGRRAFAPVWRLVTTAFPAFLGMPKLSTPAVVAIAPLTQRAPRGPPSGPARSEPCPIRFAGIY